MISLGIRRGAYSKNQQECEQYLDTKRLSSSYTGSRNRGTKGSALFFWCDVLQYRWARDTWKRGRYVVLLSNSSLNPGANGRNIVGCYMLRLSAHPVACCCVLLGVVAQSLKPVKLLATCKLACVASVSNRVIARKLEREQKKKGGRGRGRGVIPLPLPRHSFFCSRPNFLDELARKRLLRRLLANGRNSWELLAKNIASVFTGLNTELSFLYQITTTN